MRGVIDRVRKALRIWRNKPGGMAWINAQLGDVGGEGVLVNHIVKTVRVDENGMWVVEPAQRFVATRTTRFANDGIALRGETVFVSGIADHCLTPIRGDGVTKQEVAQLYKPSAPARVKEPA